LCRTTTRERARNFMQLFRTRLNRRSSTATRKNVFNQFPGAHNCNAVYQNKCKTFARFVGMFVCGAIANRGGIKHGDVRIRPNPNSSFILEHGRA
jgi:hypothetical protein